MGSNPVTGAIFECPECGADLSVGSHAEGCKNEMMVHVTRATTQADWDALDPNSYETTCAKCGAYIEGQFGPKGETDTPCPSCGSTEYEGGIGSPAGAFSLAMHDPAFD